MSELGKGNSSKQVYWKAKLPKVKSITTEAFSFSHKDAKVKHCFFYLWEDYIKSHPKEEPPKQQLDQPLEALRGEVSTQIKGMEEKIEKRLYSRSACDL